MKMYRGVNPKLLNDYEFVEIDEKEVDEQIAVVREICASMQIPLGTCHWNEAAQLMRYNFKVLTVDGAMKLQSKLKAISNAIDIMLQIKGSTVEIRKGLTVTVPKQDRSTIGLRRILKNEHLKMSLPCCLGMDTECQIVAIDLAKAPHLLIAGSTGSGKSVLVNDILLSLFACKNPSEFKLILIDPKQVEFSLFESVPHLMMPIVKSSREAVEALQTAVEMMEWRYSIMAEMGCRSFEELPKYTFERLVIVIDELANLIEYSKGLTELYLETLLAKGRACGIHVIVATQNPTRKVISGKIKANIPSVIALTTASITDSKVILDYAGAERLQGKGDALYKSPTEIGFKRFQSAFISTEEIKKQFENENIKIYEE